MKKVLLMMLLMGGTVLTTYAQRGYDRGHDRGNRGHGHSKHYDNRWGYGHKGRDYRRWDNDCYRPGRRVVYARPAYYPVVAVPVPLPVRVYAPVRPRAVFHAGVTIVN